MLRDLILAAVLDMDTSPSLLRPTSLDALHASLKTLLEMKTRGCCSGE